VTIDSLLRSGSFNGASFLVVSASTSGGRKTIKHEFPNSSKQAIEDLGFKPKTFSLVVTTVTDFADGQLDPQSYFNNRDRLIAALDRGGVGTLSHPFFSVDLQLVAMPYTFDEDTTNLGVCTFNLTFEVDNKNVIPQPDVNSLSNINKAVNAATTQVSDDIVGGFEVSDGINLRSATETLSGFFSTARDAVSVVPVVTSKINQFNASINSYQADVVALVQAPQLLADSLIDVVQSTRGLYNTVDSALDVYLDMFGFGDNLDLVTGNTYSRIQRRTNQNLMVNGMKAAYLVNAYQAAAVKEYATVDDIDGVKATLESQYDSLIDGEISGDLRDAIMKVRTLTNAFLNAERVNARRLLAVRTAQRPVRALCFAYYGADDDAVTDSIAALNNTADISFISGNIQVLSA